MYSFAILLYLLLLLFVMRVVLLNACFKLFMCEKANYLNMDMCRFESQQKN